MVMAMARGKLSPLLLLKLMPSLDTTIPTPTMVVMVITDMAMARGRLRLDTIMDTMDMVDMVMVTDMAREKLSPLLLLKLMPSLDTIIPTPTMVVMVIMDMDMEMVMDTMVKQQLFIC